ncbi:MAG: RNA polymerase subunit sigma [Flavobacterium sp. BFFFF1]|uniref:RNA polymerase sigma factor n=1 Tax=Flavobacterium sp. BFFFF1 TaxID=2015557 RepID=UPI000BD04269|nr:RNA polymerase sigma factor [Flavobacterium sp. BFFFF1]OYU80098.1 MAG: RNA polymerase subunit sigma [Flavobacterium sp. BFFFF1]
MEQTGNHIDDLIRLCKENSRSAQFELYNRYYKTMYNTALRIVKDIHWAEDIMQESFLKAFTKLDAFKGEVTFGAWLKRIVINHSIDNYKKINKNQMSSVDDILYKVPDNDQEDEGFDFAGLKAQQILECIKMLKDNYRIALTLLFVEGYDQEEIGEIMNISAGNCRTLISRAKESLRQKIDKI